MMSESIKKNVLTPEKTPSMTEDELRVTLACGEDSHNQFKRDVTNADALAAELIAFANCAGGRLFLGVADNGTVSGLDMQDVRRLRACS